MKRQSQLITFANKKDAETVAMGLLGQSDVSIGRRSKYGDGRINYRLAKWQRIKGLKGGLRKAFRNGESPLAKRLLADMVSVIAADIQRDTPKLIVHPTPETVRIESRAPSIDEAVRSLKARKVGMP